MDFLQFTQRTMPEMPSKRQLIRNFHPAALTALLRKYVLSAYLLPLAGDIVKRWNLRYFALYATPELVYYRKVWGARARPVHVVSKHHMYHWPVAPICVGRGAARQQPEVAGRKSEGYSPSTHA